MSTSKMEVFKWVCPICLRVFRSLYRAQFEFNTDEHKEKHRLEGRPVRT